MSNQLRNVDAQLGVSPQNAHDLSLKRELEGNIEFMRKLIESRYAVPILGDESIGRLQKTVEGLAPTAAITAIRLGNDISTFEDIDVRLKEKFSKLDKTISDIQETMITFQTRLATVENSSQDSVSENWDDAWGVWTYTTRDAYGSFEEFKRLFVANARAAGIPKGAWKWEMYARMDPTARFGFDMYTCDNMVSFERFCEIVASTST
jgi:hypothetical protein